MGSGVRGWNASDASSAQASGLDRNAVMRERSLLTRT